VWIAALLVACGNEAPAASPGPATDVPSTEGAGAAAAAADDPASTAATGSTGADAPSAPADPADCERVRPCGEAFVAVAPAELAGPATAALGQLDHSLIESPARAAACRDAIASFRADLERLELDVPEACR
jgi:hypothetical protein